MTTTECQSLEPPTITPVENLKRLVKLSKEREELEARLKAVKADLDALEQPLKDYFIAEGIQRTTVDDRTVYLRQEWRCFPPPGGKDKLIRSMQQREDMKDMLSRNYNTQTLWAWMRQLPRKPLPDGTPNDNGEPVLPATLTELLTVQRVDELRVVKA